MTFREGETAGLEQLIERLDKNEFDLVAVGRAMIANSDWANRVAAGESESLKAFEKEMLATLN